MTCTHERWEQIAAADGGDPGGCPICMSEEIDRLRAENEGLRGLLRDVLPIVDWSVREYHVGRHPLLEQIKATLGV